MDEAAQEAEAGSFPVLLLEPPSETLASRVRKEQRLLARDGLVYIGGTVAQLGLAFILLPFATRIMGVYQYGVLSAALAVSTVLVAIMPLGLSNAIGRLFYDEPPDAKRTEWFGLMTVQMAAAALFGLILLATGSAWGHLFRGIGWSLPLEYAVLYSVALSIQETAAGILRVQQRPLSFAAVVLTQTAVGGGLGLFFASRSGAAGYMGGLTIGAVVSASIAVALTARFPIWRRQALISGLAFGFPYVFHTLSGWVLSLSSRIVIETDLGLKAVGQYQLAYILASLAFVVFECLQMAWAPFYFRLSEYRKRTLPGALQPFATLAAGAVGLGLAACAPVLVTIAAPSSYGRNYVLIGVVAATVCVRPTYLLSISALMERKQSRHVATASITAAVVNIVLNIALVPLWGLPVSAAATFAGYGLQALIVNEIVHRRDRNRRPIWLILATWAVLSLAIIGTAVLPTTAVGWAARFSIVVAACILIYVSLQRLRERLTVNALAEAAVPA